MNLWPELDYQQLKPTIETMHLWTQIVGKIRLRGMPWINHSWHVTLQVSAAGLSTGSIPYERGIFQIEIDIIRNRVMVTTSEGQFATVALYSRSISSFYAELMQRFGELDIPVDIYPRPNEMEVTTPFAEDYARRVYDPYQMHNYWQALIRAHVVFTRFRAEFIGKASPVQFLLMLDGLEVNRFSGRTAPLYPYNATNIPVEVMQEAYSHEVSSCGFWPGDDRDPHPMFYSYCYPVSEGFDKQPVEPREAFYSQQLGEYVLPYQAHLTCDLTHFHRHIQRASPR